LDRRLGLLLLVVVASWSAPASPAMPSAIATILKALAVSSVSPVASISTIAILTVATIGTVAAVQSFAAVAERRLMRLNGRTAGCVHLIVVSGELGHAAISDFVVARGG
jgi:hypothetical protein